jgi:hypothetical protein
VPERGAPSQPRGNDGSAQRDDVGHHVPRVGEQGKGVNQQRDRDLSSQETREKGSRDDQQPIVAGHPSMVSRGAVVAIKIGNA